jgi:hypothetical protein
MAIAFILASLGFTLGIPAQAAAQSRPVVEVTAGWAGFPDEGIEGEALVGAGVRVPISPRVSIGPEIAYMRGENTIRDLMVTGNVWFDLVEDSPNQSVRATPFLVVGGGLFRHSSEFFGQTFSSNEGAFTAGGGARVWLGPSFYIAPELRIGWELHVRASVAAGFRF